MTCSRFIPNTGEIVKTYADDDMSLYLTRTWPCSCRESYQVFLGEHIDDELTDFFACKDYYAQLMEAVPQS